MTTENLIDLLQEGPEKVWLFIEDIHGTRYDVHAVDFLDRVDTEHEHNLCCTIVIRTPLEKEEGET